MTRTDQTVIDIKERLAQLFGEFADGTYSSNGTIIDGTRVDDVVDHLVSNGVRMPVLCKECVYRFERTNCRGRGPDFFCADGKKRKGCL